MELSFFEKAYQMIYSQFKAKFSDQEAKDYNIVRVDSTMVAQTANKQYVGNLSISSDELIQLYNAGNRKVPNTFRLIKAMDSQKRVFFFLSNLLEAPISQIIDLYKKRWDIEVFFRFIKQELNFGHFISTNLNGIKIILYMTMILAMLVLIYKKSNSVGYKTAKRRIAMQLNDLVTIQIVIACGGNPELVFRGP